MQYQQSKPNGTMSKKELMEFMGKFRKQKKIPVDWKTKLVLDDAWKIESQHPSPVRKRFEEEIPNNTIKKKSVEKKSFN